MSNVSDYLKWRGDLDFSQAPFNDVDNLILAQIAYVDFADIVPAPGSIETITIAEAADTFFDTHDEKEIKKCKSFIGKAPYLLREAAATKRFGSLILTNYVDYVDGGKEEQFAAFHVRIDNRLTYIAFRGTDDTLVGWKEDFNMSFLSPVPSQKDAVRYIDTTVQRSEGKLILGGHSKGGNLAVYASVFARPSVKKRIITVYNNDGPGFHEDIINTEEYKRVINKVTTYIPQDSIFGMLLNHEEKYTIVQSNEKGLMEHDAYSWQVLGKKFVVLKEVTNESKFIDKTIKNWLKDLDMDTRQQVIDIVFEILNSTNSKTIQDLKFSLVKNARIILSSYKQITPENKKMIEATVTALLGIVKENVKAEYKKFKILSK